MCSCLWESANCSCLNFHRQNKLSNINQFCLFIFTVGYGHTDKNMILLYKLHSFRNIKWKILHLIPIQHYFRDHYFSLSHNFNVLKNTKIATWNTTTLRNNYQKDIVTNKFRHFELDLLGVLETYIHPWSNMVLKDGHSEKQQFQFQKL